MQLNLQKSQLLPILAPHEINRAEEILRNCVHCGFCLATCPTYQLLGSELDSPRGRIYQIKQLMEGKSPTRITQQHLDRCLTCRNCETTCPSGIRFSELLDIGRRLTEHHVKRPWLQRMTIQVMRSILPYRKRITPLIRLGHHLRIPLARYQPAKENFPAPEAVAITPTETIILFRGCVQEGLAPATNQSLMALLHQLGMQVLQPAEEGCCGALSHHLSAPQEAEQFMHNNIEQWLPLVQERAAKVVISASGCGVMIKEYGKLLSSDAAIKVSEAAVDPAELLLPYLNRLQAKPGIEKRVVFHPPCTQQHGLKTDLIVEQILKSIGFELLPIKDRHLCCGAAGSYAILQKRDLLPTA